jgi:outer membrane protein OmpA-like peptidoglycan-associated protein
MSNFRSRCFSLGLLIVVAMLASGTTTITAQVQPTPVRADATNNLQPVPNGAKMKFKGVVISRDADTLVVRDRNRVDYRILLTDRTSVKTHGGFLRSGKKYPVTDLLRGLIIEVEGRGDSLGQLQAEKIRFNESDMRAAITAETRVAPVEANQERIAGQIDELYAVAAEARNEAAGANNRINELDDYDTQETVSVTFRVNSAVLSPEAKSQLDAFAAKVIPAKAYLIEVAGHTDSTGGETKNFRLSRARADAVVQYLAVNHKIPLRRFMTPMGYGKTEAVADNTTASGRQQNRRVEVKMMLNRGITRPPTTSSAARP